MIYKVFYQETKERNPRREQTKSLYFQKKLLNTKRKQAFLK